MHATSPSHARRHNALRALILSLVVQALFFAPAARADAVTEWNVRDGEFIKAAANLGTPPAVRIMAIAHTAAFEAAQAITKRYPVAARVRLDASSKASVDAAIAAAHRTSMIRLLPAQQAAIDSAYQAALSKIADGTAKDDGIAVGERAAIAVLALRSEDGASEPAAYRP